MRRPPAGFGMGGSTPRDIMLLLAVLFLTFSLSAFRSTAGWVDLLQLGRGVWQAGFLWQIVTYPMAVSFGGGLFFLLALFVTWMFGRDVFNSVGRRAFWRLLLTATVSGGLAAVLTQLILDWLGTGGPAPFVIMQGEQIVLSVLVAAFATLYGNATILLMFVLPIQARYFIAVELLFAFLAFLTTHDFAGFVGICVAVGVTYFLLRGGDPRKVLREMRLRLERKLLEARLKKMRKKSGLRVVKDEDDDGVHRGPWVN